MTTIRRALISVSDKTGVAEFAQALAASGTEILSTGGTAAVLREHGVAVTDVAEHTGFPEIMAGRVKTLHPKIHGGLLGRRGIDDKVMKQHGIAPIDLVAVNLYPFARTIATAGCTDADAIEQIDIGGPAMLRAAAKNHDAVTVLVDPRDYDLVLAELGSGAISALTRRRLAACAFAHTAAYDTAIAAWMQGREEQGEARELPQHLQLALHKSLDLRYGENPHQHAAFYVDPRATEASVSTARALQGKALSYNNIADADAALECVKQFAEPACVIVKHANPCGVAIDTDLLAAYQRAHSTDPQSAFGGIIAVNRPLSADLATAILERQFAEVIIAPEVGDDARAVLASKPNLRVLVTGAWDGRRDSEYSFQRVTGGLLVQDRDLAQLSPADLRVVSKRQPTAAELQDLQFAWQVARFVKSNAIVYCRERMTVGVGAGQMSRVYSARIAAVKAADHGLEVAGAVMASDAFFPFRDGIDLAAEYGIRSVIQPGGSMRDEEVIAAADEHDISMVFTGMRHFRH